VAWRVDPRLGVGLKTGESGKPRVGARASVGWDGARWKAINKLGRKGPELIRSRKEMMRFLPPRVTMFSRVRPAHAAAPLLYSMQGTTRPSPSRRRPPFPS
jgi:hypothetical protein